MADTENVTIEVSEQMAYGVITSIEIANLTTGITYTRDQNGEWGSTGTPKANSGDTLEAHVWVTNIAATGNILIKIMDGATTLGFGSPNIISGQTEHVQGVISSIQATKTITFTAAP